MRDLTFTDVEHLEPRAEETEAPFHMDEESFRAFYERTARQVTIRLMDHLDPVKRSQLVELLTEFLQGPGWVKTNR